MKKKVLALVMTLVLFASMLTVPAAAIGKTFPDAVGHWAEGSIQRWSRAGLVKGDDLGNVNPDKPLRRCEMATILSDMLGLRTAAPISTFRDINGSEWYSRAILRCAAAGIMEGRNDGMSCPEDYVTREEAITMFCRALNVPRDDDPDLSDFKDGDKVSGWAAPYMATLTELGILSGMGDGSVAPHDNINRAGAFALLDKAISVYANAPGSYTSKNANGFVVVNANTYNDGDVILSGKATGVLVSVGATDAVRLRDLTAERVYIESKSAVTVTGKSNVGTLMVDKETTVKIEADAKVDSLDLNAEKIAVTNAGTVTMLNCDKVSTVTNSGKVTTLVADAAASVTNTGTVDKLVANAPVTVNNTKGTVKNAEINIGGVVMDGPPQEMTLADGVVRPTNSAGRAISATGSVASGGSSNSGGTPSRPSTVSVTGVELDHETLEMTVEDTAPLTATVKPSGATNKKVTWESSDPETVSVSDTGLLTALKAGENVEITVTTKDGNKTAKCVVTVKEKGDDPGPTPEEPVLAIGDVPELVVNGDESAVTSAELTVTVDGEAPTEDMTVVWSVDESGVVTLDSETNTVTAAKAGQAVVTVTVTIEDKTYTKTCTVKVTDASGGGEEEVTHTIQVAENLVGGTVEVDKTTATGAETVTVTVKPDGKKEDGTLPYVVTAVTVNDGETDTTLTAGENGAYTFQTDATAAKTYTVSATFAKPILSGALFVADGQGGLEEMLKYGYPENDVTAESLAQYPYLVLGLEVNTDVPSQGDRPTLTKLIVNGAEHDFTNLWGGGQLGTKYSTCYVNSQPSYDPNGEGADKLGVALTQGETLSFELTFLYKGITYTFQCTYTVPIASQQPPAAETPAE